MYIIYVQVHSNQKFLKKKMYSDVKQYLKGQQFSQLR